MKRILIIILTAALILLAPFSVAAAESTYYDPIMEIYDLLKDQHLSNISDESLRQGAIKGMIEELDDPHTVFFTDEEYRKYIERIDGDFAGIGIYILQVDEYVEVQSTIKGSPAENAGLKAYDKLISVDGVNLKNKSTEEVSLLIRGEAGSSLKLTIKRGDKLLDFTIKRALVHIPAVASELLADQTGYLQINTFSSTVEQEIANELALLSKQGMTKLIIDLRDNPGGYLNAVINVSKQFIKEGPIVHARDNAGNETIYSITNGVDWQLPTVLLINAGSASASEILAAALKEYNKAVVIGTTSYGKGTVQHILSLNSGGYLKLTVNEYLSAHKNKVDGVGVTPDIEISDYDKQLEYAQLYLNQADKMIGYIPKKGVGWIQGNERDYIALRDLSNYFRGSISWNSLKKTVSLQIGNDRVELTQQDGGLMIRNGVSYLPVEQLNALVPSLIAVKKDDLINIYQH